MIYRAPHLLFRWAIHLPLPFPASLIALFQPIETNRLGGVCWDNLYGLFILMAQVSSWIFLLLLLAAPLLSLLAAVVLKEEVGGCCSDLPCSWWVIKGSEGQLKPLLQSAWWPSWPGCEVLAVREMSTKICTPWKQLIEFPVDLTAWLSMCDKFYFCFPLDQNAGPRQCDTRRNDW